MANLGFPHNTCMWIKSFLSDRSQRVRLGRHTSTSLSLSTGSPQGCVLSPLLYTLYTHNCTPAHRSNTMVKFADDTTVVGLISNGNESAYRDEVGQLTEWCRENNQPLNTAKTREMIIERNKDGESRWDELARATVQFPPTATVAASSSCRPRAQVLSATIRHNTRCCRTVFGTV